MDKAELFKLLKENLDIHVETVYEYGGPYRKVVITFDGQEICSDLDQLPNDH